MKAERCQSKTPKMPKPATAAKAADPPMLVDCNFSAERALGLGEDKREQLAGFLRRQMEFYFSDPNLQRDRFMREQIKLNRKGYVALATFTRFNRVRGSLTDGAVPGNEWLETVAGALDESELLRLNGQRNMVKRVSRFDFGLLANPQQQATARERTIYVEGLGEDVREPDLCRLLGGPGQVLCVDLPRYSDGRTRGYAFVEYADRATAQAHAKPGGRERKEGTMSRKGLGERLRVLPKARWTEARLKLATVG